MIDFHTHLLPGIDDGSRDPEESLAILREQRRQGVDLIIATPHFYANRKTVEEFVHNRTKSALELRAALTEAKQAPIPLKFGAEVYFFPGMGRAEKLSQLCISGTDILLVEMPFVQWDTIVYQELMDILTKQKLRVVLAHVDRYPEFQKNRATWDQVMDLERQGRITLQVNGEAFLKNRGKRKLGLRILEEHKNVILGSDCHNMGNRKPNLKDARALITKKMGQQRVDLLDWTVQDLLAK